MSKHKFTDYYLKVNLDERGLYSASVYDPNDKSVFEIESGEQVREMQDDGFLKYKPDEDLDRLTKYLMNMDMIPNGSQIWSEEKFEDKIREQYEEDKLAKGGDIGKGDYITYSSGLLGRTIDRVTDECTLDGNKVIHTKDDQYFIEGKDLDAVEKYNRQMAKGGKAGNPVINKIHNAIEEKQPSTYSELIDIVNPLVLPSYGWSASNVYFMGAYQGVRLFIFDSKEKEYQLPSKTEIYAMKEHEGLSSVNSDSTGKAIKGSMAKGGEVDSEKRVPLSGFEKRVRKYKEIDLGKAKEIIRDLSWDEGVSAGKFRGYYPENALANISPDKFYATFGGGYYHGYQKFITLITREGIFLIPAEEKDYDDLLSNKFPEGYAKGGNVSFWDRLFGSKPAEPKKVNYIKRSELSLSGKERELAEEQKGRGGFSGVEFFAYIRQSGINRESVISAESQKEIIDTISEKLGIANKHKHVLYNQLSGYLDSPYEMGEDGKLGRYRAGYGKGGKAGVKEQRVITFSNSSHTSTKQRNNEARDLLNEKLLNDRKNPLYKEFQREDIYLDTTDSGGYIAIVYSSSGHTHYRAETIEKFLEYLKGFVSMDAYVYIGDYNYKFNNYLKPAPEPEFEEEDDFGKGGAVNKSSDGINWLITG